MSRYALDPVKQRAGSLGGLARARKYLVRGPEARPHMPGAVTPKRADELRAYWRELKELADKPMTTANRKLLTDALYLRTFPEGQ